MDSATITKGFLEDAKRLVKVSTYARKHNLSTPSVYAQIKQKKLHSIKIDGVQFILENKS